MGTDKNLSDVFSASQNCASIPALRAASRALKTGDAAAEAQALKTVLSAQYEGKFIVTVSGAVVTLKQIFGGEGKLPVVMIEAHIVFYNENVNHVISSDCYMNTIC